MIIFFLGAEAADKTFMQNSQLEPIFSLWALQPK